jgi:hypothetical protein
MIAESPKCDCGAEAVIVERLDGRNFHSCVSCRTAYVPMTEADIDALLASIEIPAPPTIDLDELLASL